MNIVGIFKKQTITEPYLNKYNGLQPGGLNFDAKVRRESTDPKDLFIAHIGAMDSFARGLRNAAKIVQDGIMDSHLKVHFVLVLRLFN